MKESRFFYVPDAREAKELPEEEAVHALRVLRLKGGDEIFLMDGNGYFYRAEVTMASSKHCMYAINETLPQEKTWNGNIHLAIAPTKDMGRIEWLVEKATEIGADSYSFLDCRHSERKVVRTPRVAKIVVSAAKQSRKPWIPEVNEMCPFNEFVRTPRQGCKFICHCHEESGRKDFFEEVSKVDSGSDVTVLVGPEGDFSPEEVTLAMDNGYIPVTLGASRLRTETAGLYAVMAAQLIKRKG